MKLLHPGKYLASFKPDVKALAQELEIDYWQLRVFFEGAMLLDDAIMLRIAEKLDAEADTPKILETFKEALQKLTGYEREIAEIEKQVSKLLHKRRRLVMGFNDMVGSEPSLHLTHEEFMADPGKVAPLSMYCTVYVVDDKGKIMASASRGGSGVGYREVNDYTWDYYMSSEEEE